MDDILAWNELSGQENITETQFHGVVSSLTHILSVPNNDSQNCGNYVRNLTAKKPDFYNDLTVRFGTPLGEEVIETLLQKINHTIGTTLTNQKVNK